MESTSDAASYRLPIGPWTGEEGIAALRIEGAKTRQAWRVDGQSATTLQILAPLRDQLQAAGYEVIFECSAAACGGFDFRFETEVLPGPAMYVNLSDYRFLSARKPGEATDAVSLLVSRSSAAAFIQIIRLTDAATTAPVTVTTSQRPVLSQSTEELARRLDSTGHVALLDLEFAIGSFDLGDAAIPSLEQIAEYMAANPDRRIVFVGHTDATGSLEANIALSRRRASAAVRYLIDRHGIAPGRLSADGVGYLSPLSTNLTEEGRALNRRIEAVVLPEN
ncbi:OmpA family protein [Thalassococcus sp. BH17M4-6]|uniref:OmpA family protein n=1 Tax=Thalassococcus sp. BH17M4-6 TaxID=3413148 RepID=UPI003BE6D587